MSLKSSCSPSTNSLLGSKKFDLKRLCKKTGKTYTLFAARLRNLLSYYLKSRFVKDYDTLVELFISDRLDISPSEAVKLYSDPKRKGLVCC